jgi:hypothetical protein
MAIETKIVEWLDSQTNAGSRVYQGTRLQTSTLPAITFEVTTAQRAVLGASAITCRYDVTINAVADTPTAAMTVAAQARAALLSLGALDSASVVCNTLEALQDPQPENGDEAYLYVAQNTHSIYFDGP